MHEQRQRQSNLQPYIRTADTAGNPFFVCLFGLSTLESRALAGQDILALRYAGYLCGWQVNHHRRVHEEDAPLWWRRVEEEHQLDLRGLGEELLRFSNGESITADIAGIIARCHADSRFSPTWGNRKHLAPNLSTLHGKFPLTRLPKYRAAVESRTQPLLDRLEQAVRNWGMRLGEAHGCEGEVLAGCYAVETLSRLVEEVDGKHEELTKKKSDLAAKVSQAITKVTEAAQAWYRFIGWREALEETLGEALRLIGEAWQVEATLLALEGIRRLLDGFEDDEGNRARPGLVQVARQLKARAEQEVKRWREQEEEFQQSSRARLQTLKTCARDFEGILDGDLLEAGRLEEVFTDRIAAPGVMEESLAKLSRLLRTDPSHQRLKDFLIGESRRAFAGTLGGSLEEEVAADQVRLREVAAAVRKSRPLGSVKEEVLRRWRISRRERSLTIFTVTNPDHSAIKQALLRDVEGVTEDCFVAGPPDRLVALQEFWGLPVYALSTLAKYRDAYRSCLRDPAERSLSATPHASLIPEIEEPKAKEQQSAAAPRRSEAGAVGSKGAAIHVYTDGVEQV